MMISVFLSCDTFIIFVSKSSKRYIVILYRENTVEIIKLRRNFTLD